MYTLPVGICEYSSFDVYTRLFICISVSFQYAGHLHLMFTSCALVYVYTSQFVCIHARLYANKSLFIYIGLLQLGYTPFALVYEHAPLRMFIHICLYVHASRFNLRVCCTLYIHSLHLCMRIRHYPYTYKSAYMHRAHFAHT